APVGVSFETGRRSQNAVRPGAKPPEKPVAGGSASNRSIVRYRFVSDQGRRLRSPNRKEASAGDVSRTERKSDRAGKTNHLGDRLAGACVSRRARNDQLPEPRFPRLAFGIITRTGRPRGPN